jgi:putative ABC transport system permease protein
MHKKPLTTFQIALKNLSGKPWSTFALVAFIGILAFALFGGSVLSNSLNNGINSLEARLGADIAVIPPGHESEYEGIILSGAPVKFYFNKDTERRISGINGVAHCTSQFFLASLAASCCSEEVQLIGIDYDTDFVIKPWISQVYGSQIKDGELIIGDAITVENEKTLTFFDYEMKVAARLAKTASGMDSSVYVNMNTMRILVEAAREKGALADDLDIGDAISAVLVKVPSDYDIETVYDNIRWDAPDVGLVKSQSIVSSIAGNLNIVSGMIRSVAAVLGILAVLILVILFSVFTLIRKKEFAVMRILGATRSKLAGVVLFEALIVSLYGAISGIILAALMVLPFGSYWGKRMGLPFLMPGAGELIELSVIALILSAVAGSVAVAYSAYKVSHAETYATMREGE